MRCIIQILSTLTALLSCHPQDVTANIMTMTMDSAESMTADPGKTPLEEKEKPQLIVRVPHACINSHACVCQHMLLS